jgi:TetR/AcrR family transcriptional regulator, regulator of cefoperazone and chloramphenicol sensitivity
MPSQRPRRRDAVRTRAALLAAAGDTFARHGFRKSNVREICRAAGANLGAVSHYFGSKEAMYREVLIMADLQLLDGEAIPTLSRGQDPRVALREWVGFMLRFMLMRRPAHPHAGRLMAWELQDPTPALKDLVNQVMLPVRQSLESIVGAILADADKPELRGQCVNIILGLSVFHELAHEVLKLFGHPVPRTESQVHYLADVITGFAIGGIERLASSTQEPLSPCSTTPSRLKTASGSRVLQR